MFLQTIRLATSAALLVLAGFYFLAPADPGGPSPLGAGAASVLAAVVLWVPWRGLFITLLHHHYQNKRSLGKTLKNILVLLPALRFYHHDVRPPAHSTPTENAIRLLALNAYEANRKVAPKAEFIQAQNHDIVAVSEVNSHWELALKSLGHAYPHQKLTTAQDSLKKYKMLLLSKFPVKVVKKRANGRVVHYKVAAPHGEIYLIQVHPRAPLTPKRTETRNQTLKAIGDIKTDLPLIIMGDFNCVPWQKPVREIIEKQNLKLAGLPTPTYPASQKINQHKQIDVKPVSPLDYILMPAKAELHTAETHRVPETDHLAVSAVINL